MKKHFLFFAMLLLSGFGLLRAQETVLFTDDFESGNLDNWTLIDADGDGYNWSAIIPNFTHAQAHSGSYSAYSYSWFANVSYTPDNYMISPLVEGATKVHYYVIVNADFPEHYGVAVSSTGTDLGDFTMVFDETVQGTGWIEKEVVLPQGTKYVAFRHYDSDDKNYLFIDDVTISASASNPTVLSTANWYGYADYCPGYDAWEQHFISFNLQNIEVSQASELTGNKLVATYAKGYVWCWQEKGSILFRAPVDNHNKVIGAFETVAEGFWGTLMTGMSYNPVDGKIYYAESIPIVFNSELGRICCFDPEAPTAFPTTVLSLDFRPNGLAINRKGEAYCLNMETNTLRKLNLTDGSTKLVDFKGDKAPVVHCLAFDLQTDELIWVRNEEKNNDAVLYKMNPETADAEYIGVVHGCAYLTCLFSVPNDEGVADTQGHVIALWPNPAGNTLYLEDMDDETVSVYDYNGRLVMQETYRGQLDVSSLAPGLYVVAAKNRSMRFVKE